MKGLDIISTTRIASIMQALRDVRTLPQQLKFLSRTPVVNAIDAEILGYYDGNVVVADLVADDQKATTTQTGKITLEQTNIPNIKKGSAITQDMMNTLQRIRSVGPIPGDVMVFDNYQRNKLRELFLGIQQRMELMIIGMWRDSLSYDHNGIKFTNVSWGMPNDLKVTVGTLWSDAANATPISDIQTQVQFAREKYGVNYDRMTMTSVAFRLMVATTEFRNKAALYSQFVLPTAGTFPVADIARMKSLAGTILEMEVDIYDAQFATESNAGVVTFANALPTNEVILSVKGFDNDSTIMDFANGVVTESIIADLPGVNVVGAAGLGGPQYGPIGYATVPPDLNPPNATLWEVARGFPRKKRRSATSKMTVA